MRVFVIAGSHREYLEYLKARRWDRPRFNGLPGAAEYLSAAGTLYGVHQAILIRTGTWTTQKLWGEVLEMSPEIRAANLGDKSTGYLIIDDPY